MKSNEEMNCSGDGQCNCDNCLEVKSIGKDLLSSDPVMRRLYALYWDLLHHDGFGELQVFVRILKRGQKEVIVKSGKEYRYVIDVPQSELRR